MLPAFPFFKNHSYAAHPICTPSPIAPAPLTASQSYILPVKTQDPSIPESLFYYNTLIIIQSPRTPSHFAIPPHNHRLPLPLNTSTSLSSSATLSVCLARNARCAARFCARLFIFYTVVISPCPSISRISRGVSNGIKQRTTNLCANPPVLPIFPLILPPSLAEDILLLHTTRTLAPTPSNRTLRRQRASTRTRRARSPRRQERETRSIRRLCHWREFEARAVGQRSSGLVGVVCCIFGGVGGGIVLVVGIIVVILDGFPRRRKRRRTDR